MAASERILAVYFAVVLIVSICVVPRALGANDPPEAKKVNEVFADVAKPGSPGCALAVARGGENIFQKGYGPADNAEGVANPPQTVFDIGFTSKPFTPPRNSLLEQHGKLPMND